MHDPGVPTRRQFAAQIADQYQKHITAREVIDMPNHNKSSVSNLLSGHGRDIPLFKVFMPETVIEPLRQVLFSGYIGEGPKVAQFEQQLAPRFANENVLALNNGTAALQLCTETRRRWSR